MFKWSHIQSQEADLLQRGGKCEVTSTRPQTIVELEGARGHTVVDRWRQKIKKSRGGLNGIEISQILQYKYIMAMRPMNTSLPSVCFEKV